MSNESLYTTADTKRVREELLEIQEGRCAITNLPIPDKQAVLDHDHETQFVRAVLHRQVNAMLGKMENAHKRYKVGYQPMDLPTFLEACAKYLRLQSFRNKHSKESRRVHPAWLKKVKTEFNKLNTKQMDLVLVDLNGKSQKNTVERKNLFAKLILQREFGYDTIMSIIKKRKDE